MCFECKKFGHFIADSPSLQRLKEKEKKKEERIQGKKKKACISFIWGDSLNDEASEDEEAANLYLVAQEEQELDENEVNDFDSENFELQDIDAYNELHVEFLNLAKEVFSLRKKNKEFEKSFSLQGISRDTESLTIPGKCENCEKLSLDRVKLPNALQKFTKGS